MSRGLLTTFVTEKANESVVPPINTGLTLAHNVQYREGSGAWTLDYAMPRAAARPTPALVLIHGGGWMKGDKATFSEHCTGFANLGYFCASINYRLSMEAPFPAAVEDCKCAVRYLRAHSAKYNLDPQRIGVLGNSAGGHLALMLGMAGEDAGLEGDGPYRHESSMVQSVVSDSGPTTLEPEALTGLRQEAMNFLAGPEAMRAERIRRASPIEYVSARTPPLLLLYGVTDCLVPVGDVDAFVAATGKAGLHDVTYVRLAAAGHCPYRLQNAEFLRALVADFFHRTLRIGPSRS